MPEIHIATLQGSALEDARNELVNLLRSCVHSGASLGFLAPLPESDAADYWRGVEPQIEAGSRIVVVAGYRDLDGLVLIDGVFPSAVSGS